MRKVEKERNEKYDELEIIAENESNINELKEFYVSNEITNLPEIIEERKEKLVNDLVEFARKRTVPCKWDKEGDPLEYEVKFSPITIQQYFFKSVNPINSVIPDYNVEKLSLIYEYYCYLIAEINDKIGDFPSSINSFCKLAGITQNQLKMIKNSSPDLSLRTVAEKIFDEIGDNNITLAQMGKASEKTTIFKMKTQNEIVEKVQPNVNVNINQTLGEDQIDMIYNRINEYGRLVSKKGR